MYAVNLVAVGPNISTFNSLKKQFFCLRNFLLLKPFFFLVFVLIVLPEFSFNFFFSKTRLDPDYVLLFFMDLDSANLKRILVLVQERASKGEEGNRLDSGLGEWDSESSR